MEEVHIAHFARGLDVVITDATSAGGDVVEPGEVALGGKVRVGAGHHAWGDAFGVGVEVVGDGAHAGWVDDGAAALWGDVREEGDDEEALFGRVEVVNELWWGVK